MLALAVNLVRVAGSLNAALISIDVGALPLETSGRRSLPGESAVLAGYGSDGARRS
jgi:hypothetical protein